MKTLLSTFIRVKNGNNLNLSQGIDLNFGASVWQILMWLFKTPVSCLWMWENSDVKLKEAVCTLELRFNF